MKFLKEDGTIEEGTLLTDAQASMLEHLEEYLHMVMCRGGYHGKYDAKKCREAAQVIMTVTTTIDRDEWGEVFDEKVNPKIVESAPEPQPVTEATKSEDEIPF